MPQLHEPDTAERTATSAGTRKPYLLLVLAMATALAAGVVVGWAVFGENTDSDTASDTALSYVTPGAEGLTARQAEMVALVTKYVAAWKATDGQRLESLMVEDGYVEYPEEGWRFTLADGSLQARVSNGPYGSMVDYEPVLVYRDRIVLTGRVDAVDVPWLSVIRFTPAGEVKVISETLYL